MREMERKLEAMKAVSARAAEMKAKLSEYRNALKEKDSKIEVLESQISEFLATYVKRSMMTFCQTKGNNREMIIKSILEMTGSKPEEIECCIVQWRSSCQLVRQATDFFGLL